MVIPFMPGIEISLALFATFGELVAVPINLAILLAFLIGSHALIDQHQHLRTDESAS